MNRIIFTVLISLLFFGCDSPLNHRVDGEATSQKKLESMKFDALPFTVEIQWLTGPIGNISNKNQLMVIVKNNEGVPTSLPEGLTINFYSTMPSMGHPMDDAGFFEYLGNGIYLNTSIGYNMPGDWKNELWIMDSDYNIKDKVVWEEFF